MFFFLAAIWNAFGIIMFIDMLLFFLFALNATLARNFTVALENRLAWVDREFRFVYTWFVFVIVDTFFFLSLFSKFFVFIVTFLFIPFHSLAISCANEWVMTFFSHGLFRFQFYIFPFILCYFFFILHVYFVCFFSLSLFSFLCILHMVAGLISMLSASFVISCLSFV